MQESLLPSGRPITRGLVVREPWAGMLVDGTKRWEIRGTSTSIRGTIAVIAGGTGTIIGTCDLTHVKGPLTEAEYAAAYRERGAADVGSGDLPYETPYAWIMSNPRRLLRPVPYHHPSGAVIWVRLSPAVQAALGS